MQRVKTHEPVINQEQFDREKKLEIDQNSIKRTEISHGLDFSLHGLMSVGALDVTKITHSSLSIIHSRSLAFLFRSDVCTTMWRGSTV